MSSLKYAFGLLYSAYSMPDANFCAVCFSWNSRIREILFSKSKNIGIFLKHALLMPSIFLVITDTIFPRHKYLYFVELNAAEKLFETDFSSNEISPLSFSKQVISKTRDMLSYIFLVVSLSTWVLVKNTVSSKIRRLFVVFFQKIKAIGNNDPNNKWASLGRPLLSVNLKRVRFFFYKSMFKIKKLKIKGSWSLLWENFWSGIYQVKDVDWHIFRYYQSLKWRHPEHRRLPFSMRIKPRNLTTDVIAISVNCSVAVIWYNHTIVDIRFVLLSNLTSKLLVSIYQILEKYWSNERSMNGKKIKSEAKVLCYILLFVIRFLKLY